MKIIAITQARCGSTRLPAKVLKSIGSDTLLDIHIKRILKACEIDDLVIANDRLKMGQIKTRLK